MQARVLVAVVLLTAGPAVAATPFGSDDTGFIPPSRDVYVCEAKPQVLNGKLIVGYTKCHIGLAAAGLAGNSSGSSEEACEHVARNRFDHAVGNVFEKGCPLCIVSNLNYVPYAATVAAQVDAANGDVFCAGTTPLGDDDTGNVPPDASTFKCEAAIAKALGALRVCLSKCHARYAKAVMVGKPFDEEACESTDPVTSCRAKFNKVRDRVSGLCPPCLDTATQNTLADGVETDHDQTNDTFYCQSPSGAFVE